MLDIGQIHRIEYELENDRSTHVVIAEAPGRIHFLGEIAPTGSSTIAPTGSSAIAPAAFTPNSLTNTGSTSNSSTNTTVNSSTHLKNGVYAGQSEIETGFFLSAAIDRYIHVAVSSRKDNSFRFFAADLKERKRSTLVNLKYKREDRWANYLKPAIYLFTELGYPMKGLNFTFCGNIPQHIALASSTAIETAAATALRSLLRVQMNDMLMAEKLKEAHLAIFGNSTPLADYLVTLCARKDQFLVVDSSGEEIKLIKSPFSRFRFMLVDSRVPRMGTESEISSRRADILKGLDHLTQKREGTSFKDFASSDLLEVLGNFPEQIRRRSMHIVEEIRRVNDAADALERSDLASFAKIIYHSHESLRDLYETSCPEIDWLVKRAQEIEGAAGSRMTGPGFGGCTYTIIRRELVDEYKKRLEEYERIFGFRPVIYEVKLATKARIVPEKRVYA
ncbi:MAG: galactokinase [Treponema sp.]|nr:galactokinase [Treponema sp.]